MEPQASVASSTNVSMPMLDLWTRSKTTTEPRVVSLDCGEKSYLSDDKGLPTGRPLVNSKSASQETFSRQGNTEALPGNDYAGASDDELLAAAKASDGRAFAELSGRYVRLMRKRVYSIVRNPEETDDVIQDSLLKAYRHLQEFRGSYNFSKWITRIAINTALMLMRRRKSRPEVPIDRDDDVDQTWSMGNIQDASASTERKYAKQETLEFLSRAMNELPPMYRSVLEQYHVQEKSLRDVAELLGITVASVKSRLFRARRFLRSRLEGQQISIVDACY